jgi:hypothetical protein
MEFRLVIGFIEILNSSWLHFTITITHRLVFSVTVFTAPLGSGFQQWTFLYSRSHDLAGWQPFHTNLLLFCLPCQERLIMAAGPRYIASARAAQKTPHPTVTPLLRVTKRLHNNGCFFWLHNSWFEQICNNIDEETEKNLEYWVLNTWYRDQGSSRNDRNASLRQPGLRLIRRYD